MKRELAFALGAQSQLISSLGRTRSAKARTSDSNEVSEERSSKRLKSSINGSRSRRGKLFEAIGSVDPVQESETPVSQNNAITAYTDQKTHLIGEDNAVETSIQEKSNADKDKVENPRRFTRSALKQKEDKDVHAVSTQTENLPLVKLPQNTLFKVPKTVKELFETGLLEGHSVYYNGGSKGPTLWGKIQDTGILCSCRECKGSKVVSPSKFEVHACKAYRRAAQYICLQNGKSLLQVLNYCATSSFDSLEEMIKSVIDSPPLKESVICQNCKGPFLATVASKIEQLCESCMHSRNSQASPTDKTGEMERSPKVDLALTLLGSASDPILSQDKGPGKRLQKLLKPVVVTGSSGSSAYISSENKKREKLEKKSCKNICPSTSSLKKTKWKITKIDQKMHKLVFEEGGLPDGTEVAYYSRGQKLLEGYKKGAGIFCHCCQTEVRPSTFEAHAGWASRKKPYGYIYTSNGVSLHEFSIFLKKGRKCSSKDNDNLCMICADGGKLLLCDGCPRGFHKGCASVPATPPGKWYCKFCENMFQREKFVEHNINAKAAGRVNGVDSIEQITERCIRIVKNPEEAGVIACVLCRGFDFSKSGFGPRTVILCDQCEREYHVECLRKHKMADLKELPKGKWFCCVDCRRIHSALQNVIVRGAERFPSSLLDVLQKKHEDKSSESVTDFDVRWRLLSGKVTTPETKLLLSKAVAIFHDSFDPIVDAVTGRDFIRSMVYGGNIKGQDFGGMYCAILTVNSSVVSAAIFRVLGLEVAELPLVATSSGLQGKGYFQSLYSCIEKLLAFLKVKTLVLPAAEKALSIWTKKFGFEKLSPQQLKSYEGNCWQMIAFKGTSMLQKKVPQCRFINQDAANVPNKPS